jgi:hypothetical protein
MCFEREMEFAICCIVLSLHITRDLNHYGLVIVLATTGMIVRTGELSYVCDQICSTPNATGVGCVSQEDTWLCSGLNLQRLVSGYLDRDEHDFCTKRGHLGLVEVVTESFAVWRSTVYDCHIASKTIARQCKWPICERNSGMRQQGCCARSNVPVVVLSYAIALRVTGCRCVTVTADAISVAAKLISGAASDRTYLILSAGSGPRNFRTTSKLALTVFRRKPFPQRKPVALHMSARAIVCPLYPRLCSCLAMVWSSVT